MLENYLSWLRARLTVQTVGKWYEITTPYLDRHNDCLQIYVRQNDDGTWLLSDGGSTIADLEMSGAPIESEKRKAILSETLRGFGVRLTKDDEIQTDANEGAFPQRKHHLLQAMLTVGDMFQLSSANVQSIFLEEVARWLFENEVWANRSVNIVGKSGLDHRIDFAIPAKPGRPERLLNVLTSPRKDKAELLAFRWIDIRDSRQDARPYAMINDAETTRVPQDVVDILTAYDIKPIPWTQRADVLQELAA
jgi:hypothetical protein